jgi:hypothetical protein
MKLDRSPPHKSKGGTTLELPRTAEEFKATANLVWLADTGASYDVVLEGLAEIYGWRKVPLSEPIRINTANGPAESKGAVLTRIPGMSEEVHAVELGDTPPLLSVGRRCLNEGYSFVWIAGRNPYFVTKEGMILPCKTSGGVPYIDTEDPDCKLRPVNVPGKGSYVRMIELNKGTRKKLVIVGAIGIPHGQQNSARALVAGTFPAIDKPTLDDEFEEEGADDVSGGLPAVSGELPMTADENRH